MKKLLALLLALGMIFSLAACGKEEPEETKGSISDKVVQTQTEAPTQAPTQVATEPPVTGELLEMDLWDLIYDADVWVMDEDYFYDEEDYSRAILYVPDDGDSYVINAEIEVSIENHENFRDLLDSYDFDQYEYAVNDAYEKVNVGGVDCLVQEGNYWGEPCLRYLMRVEEAGATVFLEIIGEYEDPLVAELLKGLTFKLTDVGNVDAPWAWDGEPFSTVDASAMAGAVSVNSHWLPITDSLVTGETFDHSVAVSGDRAYILGDGVLTRYIFDGTSLVYDGHLDVEDDYEAIQVTEDGTLWLSGFMVPLMTMVDDTATALYEGPDCVAMHPSGTWGVSWFSGPECQMLTFADGLMYMSPITFPEVDVISSVTVDEDYIYVCGYAVDDSGHKVFVYDPSGQLQMVLADQGGEALGSVTFMAQTSSGFIGMDGNMRDVVVWTADGTYVGSMDGEDLFGTYYPWFCGGTKLSDGSLLVIMTEDRADESAMEVIAFLLDGF